MSYQTGTILTRVDPYEKPPQVEKTTGAPTRDSVPGKPPAEDLTPLNVIRILAPSPVRSASLAEWAAGSGEAYVVTPHESFGGNQVAPTSILQAEYEITSIPEDEPVVEKKQVPPSKQQSPEQVFAQAARDAKKKA